MKITTVYKLIPVLVLSVALCGCVAQPLGPSADDRPASFLSNVRVIGLTELTEDASGSEAIDVYVDIDDFTEGRVLASTAFRFELFEYVVRSQRHIGSRIYIWPDIVVSRSDKQYWKDHLKAYNFRLPIDFTLPGHEKFVLQVTVIAATDDRDSDLFILKKN